MIKAKRSNLYTIRPDEPRKEGQLALLEAPETTEKWKLGVGKEAPALSWLALLSLVGYETKIG
jgi:hypothetical protein